MWNKFLNLFTILTLFSLLIAPVGRASAQESSPFGKKIPLSSTGIAPTPSQENTTPSTSGILTLIGNNVQDPSFEASLGSQTFWGQSSTNFDSPLCNLSGCGNGAGTAGPRTGNVWVWFGGTTSPEEGQVWQNVTFPSSPSCGATLQFYFWIGQAPAGSDANDTFIVGIDGIGIFSANATQASSYPSYTLVSLNVSEFADGGVHLVQFYSNTADQIVNFNLDDVSLVGCQTISGNAGTAGASLSYTGGSTTANGSGNYSFNVPTGWTGTVTPSLRCFSFSPASRTYNNVTTDQTGQNYSASANSACATITVRIGEVVQGTRLIPRGGAERLSFPLNSGPVFVNSSNNVTFVASERVIPRVATPRHFSELMGLPTNLAGTQYAFPAYDNVGFDSQLRIANIGNATTTVRLFIAGSEMTSGCNATSPLTLARNTSVRVSCAGVNNGPVMIRSSGAAIIASLRVLPRPSNGSFSEVMGLPCTAPGASCQWNTSYIFPWYNNLDLNTQIRVANISGSSTVVRLFIGGREMTSGCISEGRALNSPFPLPNNASKRLTCAGIDSGPVRLTSTAGNLVASMRILFPKSGTPPFTGFSEIMGMPESQLASGYIFPWYNNVALNTQLRFANVGTTNTSVRVFMGGQEVAGSPFALAAGQSMRRSFAVDKGPVVVRSTNGTKIIASLRILFQNGSTYTSFSELMGLPEHQMTTSYIFPYYNNIDLNTQLRLGVP